MRMLGYLPNETSAAAFSDFLYVQGISNEVEADKEGWAVWIHSEDELMRAREFFFGFLGNPGDPKFQEHSKQARELKAREQQEEAAAEKRHFDRSRVFRATLPYGVGPLTFSLIFACVGVWAYAELVGHAAFENALHITRYEVEGYSVKWLSGLPEVSHGEVWRLITPILLHGGLLHLFFNMLWLLDLGSMIENRQSSGRLALLVVVIAVTSNFGQYWMSGPAFRGMSGVVYGLLGYVWMKGKFDSASGLFLHPQTVTMMLIWFFLCFTGWVGNIANTAHAVGLMTGMAWGFLASLPLKGRSA